MRILQVLPALEQGGVEWDAVELALELQARGVWSGSPRPMLMCALGRTETARLKAIVARVDPDAIMIVSNVHEAFGEGFGQFGKNGL